MPSAQKIISILKKMIKVKGLLKELRLKDMTGTKYLSIWTSFHISKIF